MGDVPPWAQELRSFEGSTGNSPGDCQNTAHRSWFIERLHQPGHLPVAGLGRSCLLRQVALFYRSEAKAEWMYY